MTRPAARPLATLATGLAAVAATLATATPAFAGADPIEVGGVTPDAGAVIFDSDLPLLAADINGARDVYLRTADGLVLLTDGTRAGTSFSRGLSTDGTRAVFETDQALVAADTDAKVDVYAWQAGALELLSSGPADTGTSESFADAISPDATRVLFHTAEPLVPSDQNTAADLYLRAGQAPTMVSARSGASTQFASFEDATPDLHKVAWSTKQAVAAGDTDGAHTDVYVRDLDGATASVLVSGGGNGAFDTLGGTLSDDGTKVHFVTSEKLSVADTDTARDVYRTTVGGVPVLRSDDVPAGDANVDAVLTATSADGSRTLWSTTEAIASDTGADGDTGRDLFEATGGVPTHLSTGPALSSSDGTATISATPIAGGAIFTTTEGLVAEDTDGLSDVYARIGATTTLLTPGGSAPVYLQQVAADGATVLVTTTGRLSADDTDDTIDAYLAGPGLAPRLLTPGTSDDVDVAAATPDLAHVLILTNAPLSADDADAAVDLYEIQPATGTVRLQSTVPAPAAPGAPARPATPATPGTPPVTVLPRAPRVAIGASITRRGIRLRITVSCPAGGARCAGTLGLRSAKRLVKGRRGRPARTLSLGTKAFTITPGRRGVVVVTVPKAARSRLAAALRGGVVVTATTRGTGLQPRTARRTLRRAR